MEDDDLRSFTSRKLDIQNAIMLDSRLRPAEYRLAGALLSHMNADTGLINPSQELLAMETGMSPRYVIKCLKALEAAGWVKVHRSNRQLSNRYEFLTHLVDQVRDNNLLVKEALHERRAARKSEVNKKSDVNNSARQDRSDVNTSSLPEVNTSSHEHLKVTPPSMGLGIEGTVTEQNLVLGTVTSAPSHHPQPSDGSGEGLAPRSPQAASKQALPSPANDRKPRSIYDELAEGRVYKPDYPLRDVQTFRGKPIVPPDFGSPITDFRPVILDGGGDWIVADETGRHLSRHATQRNAFREIDRLTAVHQRRDAS